ncbi:hypothetical protein VIN01S_29360 [Vibrio inusitatus NBRC 102082]|uniref:DUF3429 domain-containing protein n=1 Tax=Vibrio inusitatus NBRC 102082 TaxID=1219070 RepID=A0A4Y3HZV5_9VIBR|nr:DUF3429 domain-containing protein [Vibrio inusitatus]GEA52132.1 hypothetical protein VIN01S_29360 [Vibrio inusitatus NBRC 102082]
MTTTLGYMGLIPFIFLPLLYGYSVNDYSFHFLMTFLVYSGGIAIFMAGAVWGRCVDSKQPKSLPLVASNVITLVVIGLGLLAYHSPVVLLIGIGLAHGFNLMFEPKRDNPSYQTLRVILTSVVLASHLVMLGLFVLT